MAKSTLLTRRKFLIAGGLVGGGLAVAYAFGGNDVPDRAPYASTAGTNEFTLNAWVKISSNGNISVAISQAEMGQGIHTALCMLVAEELEVDVAGITPEQAPIDAVYANFTIIQDSLPFGDGHHRGEETAGAWAMKKVGALLGIQATGGSTSVRNFWLPMQQAGATARQMLIQAAADRWSVPASECYAKAGKIIHDSSDNSASYGELAQAASKLDIPEEVSLKQPSERRVIGYSQQRIDIPAKVTGEAEFGVDVSLPDMVYAAVKICPTFGGTVKHWDESKIGNMPGVLKAVKLENAVAVVANSFWRAKQAVEQLPVTFDDTINSSLSTDGIFNEFEEQLKLDDGRSYAEEGDAKSVLSNSGASKSTATYKVPFLAHACMEPMNCTAIVTDTSVEVWTPNQSNTLISWIAQEIAEVDAENVSVHNTYLGGGFGRKVETDCVSMTLNFAKAFKGRPVKLIWTRENDMQHDMYRPAALAKFEATLDSQGRVQAWHNKVASPSISRAFVQRMLPFAGADMPDNTTVEGAADIPYEFPHKLMEHFPTPVQVPIGYWRSVGHSYNAFFTECFMDELAAKAEIDPIEFRRLHLSDSKDFLAVLNRLEKESNWKEPAADGHFRGIALHESFGSIVGQVVEISVSPDKEITLHKVTCVIDCGEVLNLMV
ncbi:xanthine dehydrogenase family protein molybdopterin-binding subunit [Sneathiella glossodoripedis]|uniref:xanthine dehydrogenase family protein molybdopterin-binding subunit n=1 Tax=Sneathiella glossodoripedis TaxID=418853 RepID=UPI000685A91F|nr:molybdopterin cofactor-binding domain-containing protein [Sneathiella glossodoripedis]